MSVIKITVNDQALYVTDKPVIASQGVNENYIQCTFSPDWADFGVIALFYKEDNETEVYESVVSGDGKAIHQFLHVDDAALGFVGAMERDRCIGQAYNLVRDDYVQFDQYHRTAMEIIGKEVPMVGLPLDTLLAIDPKRFKIAGDEFSFNIYCAWEKVYRDIPEFRPKISLKEGMTRVLEALDRDGRIPNSDTMRWEDDLIAMAQAIREYRITV
jgi:nucleoside-diphosphate-sugar epimerase